MNKDSDAKEHSTELVISAASSLVGFAIGGPIGAVVGNATIPTVKLAHHIVQSWMERRKNRLATALDNAFSQTQINDNDLLQRLEDDHTLSDDIIRMLRQLVDTDPELDSLFTSIIASMVIEPNGQERNRLIVLSDSIKGLNKIQLEIIKLISLHGGSMSATEISSGVSIPEIELRNSVRDLELRGIISDNNSEPTIWHLRELGIAIAKLIIDTEDKHEN